MRRVAGIPILVAVALTIAITSLLLSPSNSADAVPWTTTYTASLSSTGVDDRATLTTVTTIPSPNYFFDQFITTLPNGFKSRTDISVPNGAIIGEFTSIVNLGIANGPCTTILPVSAALLDATTGIGGGFVPLSTVAGGDADAGVALVAFTGTEKHTDANGNGDFDPGEKVYGDLDSDGLVSTGDFRFNSAGLSAPGSTVGSPTLAQIEAGLTLQFQGPPLFLSPAAAAAAAAAFAPIVFGASNPDLGLSLALFATDQLHDESVAANGTLDLLEEMYTDNDTDSAVSAGDTRLTPTGGLVTFDEGFADGAPAGPGPGDGLPDGVTSYPVAIESRLPQSAIGTPTNRSYAQTTVAGTKIEVHQLEYAPGSLGLPASLGNPTITFFVTGDPGVPQPGNATDNCSFFSSTFKTFGRSSDNLNTPADESGFQVLRNPSTPGLFLFGSFSLSQRDLDNDSFANGQDACQFDPNAEDLRVGGLPGDPDGDGIDTACDPFPSTNDGADIDGDGFLNRLDNCTLIFNPTQLESEDLNPGAFGFDGGPKSDDIGDACEDPGHEAIPDGHFHTSALVGSSGPLCAVGFNCGGAAIEAALGCTVASCSVPPSPPLFFSPLIIGASHDVQLSAVGGAQKIKGAQGAQTRTYDVDVKNKSATSEDIQVALRVDVVTADCAVNGGLPGESDTQTAVETVAAGGSATVSFTVVFDGCTGADTGTSSDYVVSADACHADDAAPSGLFGAGACPGSADGGTDGNAFNDAPKSRSVNDTDR